MTLNPGFRRQKGTSAWPCRVLRKGQILLLQPILIILQPLFDNPLFFYTRPEGVVSGRFLKISHDLSLCFVAGKSLPFFNLDNSRKVLKRGKGICFYVGSSNGSFYCRSSKIWDNDSEYLAISEKSQRCQIVEYMITISCGSIRRKGARGAHLGPINYFL